jgi:transposase InsO family protein/uncharacterized membrane protein YgcG
VAGTWGPFPASPALGPAWGAAAGALPTAGTASALAAVADAVPAGAAGPEDPPPPIPPSLDVDPPLLHRSPTRDTPSLPSPLPVWSTRRDRPVCSDCCGTRVGARARGYRRYRCSDCCGGTAPRLAYGPRRRGHFLCHLGGATVGTVPRTITPMLWHDPTDPLVAQLHLQAGSIQNICLMVPVVLEPESPSYARWRDLLLLTLHRYALDDQVLCDPTGVAPTATWVRLDSIVLSWIVGTVSIDLHSLLRNIPHARVAWLAIEGQFLGNAEARALRLDAAFWTFVQGDLSVSEYCRKMKAMADSLGDMGCPVEDCMLVLNVLHGLSDRYTHLRSMIMRQRPFPTFLQVRDDLALEEITMGTQAALISGPGSSSSSTALAALTPTRPPTPALFGPSKGGGGRSGGSGGGGGRRRRGGRGGGGGSGNGARTHAPTPGPQQGAPWPTFHHPWSGRISMWPFQGPGSEARPPAAMFAGAQPGFTSPPGFAFASSSPWTSPVASSWPTPLSAPPSGLVGWDAAALAAFQTPTLTPPMGPEWIADTGATYHTTPDPGILTSVRPPSSLPSSIMVANGSCLPVTSMGAASSPGSFRIPDVLVAPSLVHNLLSIRRFTTDNSYFVEFDSSGLSVKDSETQRPLLRCDSTGPLYTLRLPHATPSSSSTPTTTATFAATMSSTTWHRRLGHPGRDALMQLTRSATIQCTRSNDEHLCHACQLDRHVRLPFCSSSSHATHAFDLVHCDLWTSPITSMSGYKYYLVVLDDFSHYVWTFPLRAKAKTFPALRHFFAWVSTQFGLPIKVVQCDNGREFDNSTSRDFFLSHGMQLRMSCPYTSSQNGKAERMIRTTNDTIRTLLLQAHLPARFWAEALHTSTYLLNRLPSTACPAPTPHQALFGTPPRYDHLRVFRCACYPNTAATAPHKLTPRSTLCVFLGYSPDHKGYRCFDLSSHRVLISRHVVFDEFVFPYSTTTPPSSDPDLDLFTLFPTDTVVEPPILPLSAGTRSPLVGPPPGPVPCPGPVGLPAVVTPLRGSPSPLAPGPSGGGGSAPPGGRRYRPLQPASPSLCGSTSAGRRRRGSHLHRRRRHHHRRPHQ